MAHVNGTRLDMANVNQHVVVSKPRRKRTNKAKQATSPEAVATVVADEGASSFASEATSTKE